MSSLLISTNPAKNYSTVGSVPVSTEDEIIRKVEDAHRSQPHWHKVGARKRIVALQAAVDDFMNQREELAQLITAETGKSILEARGELERYLSYANWYLTHGEQALQDEIIEGNPDSSIHTLVFEPWGVVAAISPWNFPFGMALWGIFPSLIAGNTVVAKVSEECPLTGKMIEDILKQHLPEGVFAEVYGDGEVGDLLTDQDINYIWFTGSTRTGSYLYRKAADKFIRATLEMGGSSPVVVFADADLKKSAELICALRFRNCGQVCTSMKRLIVEREIHDPLVDSIVNVLKAKHVGDPNNESTDMGSLVAKRQVDHLQSQVEDALNNQAHLAYKGSLDPTLRGAFFPPMVMTKISRDMRIWREEVFGPVLPVMPFDSEDEAIRLANDTEFGLNARVISGDIEKAKRVAREIQAGGVKLNYENSIGQADPFGGYKHSGIGREHGIYGIRELCQMKVIVHE